MKSGARGCILKNAEPEALIHAILHIARGGVIVSPFVATKLLTEFKDLSGGVEKKSVQEADAALGPREVEVLQNRSPLDLSVSRDDLAELAALAKSQQRLYLSERELAILRLIADGVTTKEIANQLF